MMTEKVYNAIVEAKDTVYNGWYYDEFNPQDFRSVMDFVDNHSKDPLLMEAIKAVLSASNWDLTHNGVQFYLPRTADVYDYMQRNKDNSIDVSISIYATGYDDETDDSCEMVQTVSAEYPHGSKWEVID